ncbi:S-adenosyl-L-methionine-dependent methyltransferase, partial [Ophiobolus disseminans]
MFRVRPSLPRSGLATRVANRSRQQLRCASAGRPKGLKDHWTAEKLATVDDYPLSSVLKGVIHPSMMKKKTRTKGAGPVKPTNTISAVNVRTQIVSPRVCDDILKYIGHTLEKHKGCDILDINPGACLWSQKLHDFLQPRSHVLLEPSPEIFKQFLDPLLDAPDSTYKLVSKDPLLLPTYKEIVDEGIFPHQIRVNAADPNGQDINNTLLVTGSLAWDPKLPGLGFDSMAKQIFHYFAGAAWSNDLFHAYGPVHMLLWTQSDDFTPMVAQSTSGMHRGNRMVEMTQDLNLVVASTRRDRSTGRGALGREPQYELESLVRALRSGRERGMEVPPHRRDFTFDFAKHIEDVSGGTGISSVAAVQNLMYSQHLQGIPPTGLSQGSLIEVTETERHLRDKYPDLPMAPPGDDHSALLQHLPKYPTSDLETKFKMRRRLMTSVIRTKFAVEASADIGEQMYLLECEALKMGEGPKKESIIKQVEDLDLVWDQSIKALQSNYQLAPISEVDDRISLRHSLKPRIQWDKRPFEPLLFHEDEAWPRNRLSLVSASPIPRPKGESDDYFEWVQDFVHAIFADPVKPVAFALDTMQHGLSEIMKDCPSLRDPDRGGRLQMKHLRVRVLTMDIINELVRVYRDWPFKAPGTDHSRYFRHKTSGAVKRGEYD